MKVRVGVAGVLALFLILAFGARSPVAADGPAGGALYGKFVWNDLLTKDLPAARAFYASMFGWTFREQTREGRPYLIAELDGKPVAGLLDVHDMKEADPQWVSFVSVPDVDAVAEQVRAAGGKVLVAPRAVKVGGRAAVVPAGGAKACALQHHHQRNAVAHCEFGDAVALGVAARTDAARERREVLRADHHR